MTLYEFDKQMERYQKELDGINDKDFELWQDKVSKLQYDYMNGVIASYSADTKAREAILDLLIYATRYSQSGSAIVDVENEVVANMVEEIIWSEIGDYLLDYEIYENQDRTWSIDCMFAGNYVPYWDGWLD